MNEYLVNVRHLLHSPFTRAVDYRICAYTEGFTIVGDAKGQIQMSQLLAQPIPQKIVDSLVSLDQRADAWFHEINNDLDPLYQTFHEQQDRNRFMVPYTYIKL